MDWKMIIIKFLELVVGQENYNKLLKNQPFLENKKSDSYLNMYMGFVRIQYTYLNKKSDSYLNMYIGFLEFNVCSIRGNLEI